MGKISIGGIFVKLVFCYAYCLVQSGSYIHAVAHLKVDISINTRDTWIDVYVHHCILIYKIVIHNREYMDVAVAHHFEVDISIYKRDT